MQGDDGLAGARAALHDEHAGLRRADDLVLLGLDRGDDVAERARCGRARARRAASSSRGAGAPVGSVVRHEPVVVADAEVALAEQLVLDAEQVAALDGEVAAADQAHRLARRWRGRTARRPAPASRRRPARTARRPPPGGRCGSSRSVVGRLGVAVDAAEHQRGVAEIEVGQPLDQRLVERVALEAGLERAAEVGLGEVPQPPRCRLGSARGTRRRDRCRPARRPDQGAAASFGLQVVIRTGCSSWSGRCTCRKGVV